MPVTSSQVQLGRSPSAVQNFFNPLQPVNQIAGHGGASTSAASEAPNVLPKETNHQTWFRVSQLAEKHKEFTENAIRAQIFAAKPRPSAKTKDGISWIEGNGLAPAIRKCGRAVLINESMYAKWIATGSCTEGGEK
ncbi:hypothetical protein [Rhodoferax sp. WC2427]|uniref:hypothetical protein n=1 Tax=Rhodoferax sp. WC2427 TaxID=3234144 RepID=UPI003466F569